MNIKIKALALAAALATGGANAALLETFSTSNSSLIFGAIDATGAPTSFVADLDYNLSDFDVSNHSALTTGNATISSLLQIGTKVTWDFRLNTITVLNPLGGINTLTPKAGSGTHQWSSQFATFDSNTDSVDTRFGVFAGALGASGLFLTTGNPTAGNLTSQTGGNTANLTLTQSLWNNNNNKGTIVAGAHAGANTVVGGVASDAASGYLIATNNLGGAGNWQTRLSWSALVNEGSSSAFHQLRANNGTELRLGGPASSGFYPGAFTYNDGVLVWAVPVPEPGTYAMLLAGLGAVGFMARRRRAGR